MSEVTAINENLPKKNNLLLNRNSQTERKAIK